MNPEQLKQVARFYNLEPKVFAEPTSGYRNTIYPVILKDGQTVGIALLKNEPGIITKIKNANYLSKNLHKQGYPARYLLSERILKIQTKNSSLVRYAVLYNYLPGTTIPWEAYTMEHIKLLGKYLSDMHSLATSLPLVNLPKVSTVALAQLKIIRHYLNKPGVNSALINKLSLNVNGVNYDLLDKIIMGSSNLKPQLPLHMDFVRGNILYKSNPVSVTGIIDFEKTAYGHPVFDIARTLAFLLVDCANKPSNKVYKYFLQSGYNKRGQHNFRPIIVRLGHHKYNLLEQLVNFYLLYDFYKFLTHNPYESLPANHHFIRTRDILITKNILMWQQ